MSSEGEPVHTEPESAVDRLRRKLRVFQGPRGRMARTIPSDRLSEDEQILAERTEYPDVDRPRTRGDCKSMSRPCPFVSCSHHLYLDVNPDTGAIKINFPRLEVWEMRETCSLDVADRNGITLEEIGAILGVTRERIRQVENDGLAKMKDAPDGDLGLPERGRW